MFEIGLDLTLLQYDRQQYPTDKLRAWERSSKLHHAEAVVRYLDKHPGAAGGTGPLVAFAKGSGAAVRAERAQWWPPKSGEKVKHPARWTGRNLDQDAVEADKLADRGFVEFYENRYRQICWNVHGSGLAGIVGLDMEAFPALTLWSFDSIGHFATVAAEMALRFVDKWDLETTVAFENLSKARRLIAAEHLAAHRARQNARAEGPST